MHRISAVIIIGIIFLATHSMGANEYIFTTDKFILFTENKLPSANPNMPLCDWLQNEKSAFVAPDSPLKKRLGAKGMVGPNLVHPLVQT